MMSANSLNLNYSSFKENFTNGLPVLRQNAEFVDVTLAAEGYFLKAHQNVLALASPYIKEMLLSSPCQHPVIFLNNVTSKLLEYVLEYIYTGEVNVPRNTVDEFIALCKRLCIQGIDYGAVSMSQPHSDANIGTRSVQELDHSYTSHIIIETPNENVDCKPIFDNVHQDLPLDVSNEHDYSLTKDTWLEPINLPDPPENLSCLAEKKSNIPQIGIQDNITNLQKHNLPNINEDMLPITQIDITPAPSQDTIVCDINREASSCTKALDLPILLGDITLTPQINPMLLEKTALPPEIINEQVNQIDCISKSEANGHPCQVTVVENTNPDNNIIRDLSDFIVINTGRTNNFSDNPIEKTSSASDRGTGVHKPGTKLQDHIPQFRVSKRGTLHLMLNKYLYHCHHQSSGGQKRRWRCINYRKLHCRAVIDTFGDDVTNRHENHIHPAPSIAHINRFRKDTIYTILSKAAITSDARTLVIRKRK